MTTAATDKTLVVADHVLTGFDPAGRPEILADAAVLIMDETIAAVGPADELRRTHPDAREIGGRGRVAIPGLVNAHHHVGVTTFQLGARDQPLELWFPERLAMRDVDPRLDTLYSAFEMVASGVTTVQHLHSRAPGDADAVIARAEAILGAYVEVGLRASYSFALRDQNRMIYATDEDFIASLPDAAIESTARMGQDTGAPMQMHVLETPYQAEYARRRTGGSALAHIDRFGLLGPQLTIGHGVWMTPEDVALLAERGGCLCHNCSSNLRLKSGTADLNGFLASGVPVALGIDEAGINDDRDMLQEMRLALTLHRPPGHAAPAPTAAQVLRMATEHGATTTPFADRLGRLAPGMLADIVLLDWKRVTWPWQEPDIPLVDVLVRRAKAGAVETVIVGGAEIYTDGVFRRVDRDRVLEELSEAFARPDTAAEARLKRLSRDLHEPTRAFYRDWFA